MMARLLLGIPFSNTTFNKILIQKTNAIEMRMKRGVVLLYFLIFACLFACNVESQEKQHEANQKDASQLEGDKHFFHGIDTLKLGTKLDYEICWLTFETSILPKLKGLPKADFWNDSIVSFESYVKRRNLESPHNLGQPDSFCCGRECEGDEYIKFPRLEGLVGTFDFTILSWKEDVISILLTCNVHPSGGNLDWNNALVLNIDPKTGLGIPLNKSIAHADLKMLDEDIRNCVNVELCREDFREYNHSVEFQNYLQLAIEEHRIGVKDGHWVVCDDINPFSYCSSASQTICIVKVEPFDL